MIKLVTGGQVVLGLSELNLTRLREGKPIQFPLSDLGLGTGLMWIVYGATEADICATLGVDPDTGVVL